MRDSGHLLAQYLCDDRTEFLDAVFNEIRQFVDEFIDTVKVRIYLLYHSWTYIYAHAFIIGVFK